VQVQHWLIIRHPLQTAILLINDNGEARLPAFTSDDRHTAEVEYINAAVRARFGLLTTVLRSLHHSAPHGDVVVRVHELETHGDSALRSHMRRWYEHTELLSLLDGEDRATVAEWLADETAHRSVVDGREWTRLGWLKEVRGWIERVLRDAGLGTVRDIIQLRAWPSSCVLRVRAAGGDYYFKAVPESLRRECAVTEYLAHHFPDAVPRLISTEPARRWLLMAACAGRKLEEVTDMALWEHAATRYARLQAACVPRVRELGALGCALRSLDMLAKEIGPLSSDTAALRPGEPDGLSVAEIERLRALKPLLQRQCEQLAACGIPYTLEHGDLWPGNFLIDHNTCVIIDWEDVAIAHPFFSLAPLSVGMYQSGLSSPAVLERLERAYLAAFAEMVPPERLCPVLHMAMPLSFIDMAVRYRHQPPSVVRLHPWMRDLVPQTLRFALARIA
jgi:aminoglycoside phosphotransferase (APT) family kinase protein